MRLYRSLLVAATLLALLVIGLGAYVRLSDAGLGCPDWPGCYGHWLGVPDAGHERLAAQAHFPQQPLDSGKAWKEMIHRYCAGTLGLLILAICLLAWRPALRRRQSPILPTVLLGLIGLQAALGMWTVTLLLKPAIVTLHLLGGMGTLALLLVLLGREWQASPASAAGPGLRLAARLALLATVGQIALGGWVSSNYAGLACPDLPRCQGQWQPAMDFGHAFAVVRDLGYTAHGQLLNAEALTAIHWAHRLGAAVVAASVLALAIALGAAGERDRRRWAGLLLGVLGLQIALGIGNVLLSLPLPVAVAHTLGAAGLLGVLLTINLRLPAGEPLAAERSRHGRRAPGLHTPA